MGQGHRYFVFEDSGELRPLTHENHQRLHDGETSLPEYADKRIRIALVFLYTEDRSPAEIKAVECSYLQLDGAGFIDKKWSLQWVADALDAVDGGPPSVEYLPDEADPNLVDLARHLSRKRSQAAGKRLEAERWQPSQEDMAKISNAALKRKRLFAGVRLKE